MLNYKLGPEWNQPHLPSDEAAAADTVSNNSSTDGVPRVNACLLLAVGWTCEVASWSASDRLSSLSSSCNSGRRTMSTSALTEDTLLASGFVLGDFCAEFRFLSDFNADDCLGYKQNVRTPLMWQKCYQKDIDIELLYKLYTKNITDISQLLTNNCQQT